MTRLVYEENGERLVLAECVTNFIRSIDGLLEFLEIDMDEVAKENGWDDWNPEALKVEIE